MSIINDLLETTGLRPGAAGGGWFPEDKSCQIEHIVASIGPYLDGSSNPPLGLLEMIKDDNTRNRIEQVCLLSFWEMFGYDPQSKKTSPKRTVQTH